MKVILVKNGISSSYKLSSDLQEKVNKKIAEIFGGIDDVLKIYFSEESLKELKSFEEILEIIYNEPILLATNKFDTIKVKKIIFPLTGDLIGNSANPEITVITGEEEYDSTPFRNTKGFALLMQLKKLVKSGSLDK